jgi:hypothetical protein
MNILNQLGAVSSGRTPGSRCVFIKATRFDVHHFILHRSCNLFDLGPGRDSLPLSMSSLVQDEWLHPDAHQIWSWTWPPDRSIQESSFVDFSCYMTSRLWSWYILVVSSNNLAEIQLEWSSWESALHMNAQSIPFVCELNLFLLCHRSEFPPVHYVRASVSKEEKAWGDLC